jgi:hypothetical protein
MNNYRLVCQSLIVLLLLAARPVSAQQQAIQLDCRVQYKQDGEVGLRPVTLTYAAQGKKLKAISIDGQDVHSFTVNGLVILTSVDSERIQIEFSGNRTLWRSNFRDRDFGTGECLKR